MPGTYLIVGASLAGATAAATLREEGFDGSLTLIGEEPHPPYERPPLSKEYLRGEEPFKKVAAGIPNGEPLKPRYLEWAEDSKRVPHAINTFAFQWWWNSRGYTPAGVEAWNCVRALDYLETRPEVDASRIGVTRIALPPPRTHSRRR